MNMEKMTGEILAQFLEANFEEFQLFLEDEHEIEGTEAERIIDELKEQV